MKRDRRFHVTLNDEERELLEQKAATHGTKMSEVLRAFLRRGLGLPIPSDITASTN